MELDHLPLKSARVGRGHGGQLLQGRRSWFAVRMTSSCSSNLSIVPSSFDAKHWLRLCVENFQRDCLGCFCRFECLARHDAWLAQICDLRLVAAREGVVKSLLD